MLNNAVHIIKNMGLRYTLYRVQHELEKKAGVLKRRHPIDPPVKKFVSLEQFRRNSPRFVIHEREKIAFEKHPNADLKNRAERIIRGEVPFFSSEWKDLGKDYDWITNPDNGYRYDINKHWSEIADFSSATGDIKYAWEKSRFTLLLTIIRNDYHHDEDHSGFVFDEIAHWIDANPVNRGPNWRCSQEISLRILNWCFALQFYKHSAALTEERWDKIQHVIYWSLHHVYHHIDFSRIAVRNNHAITETLFLTLSHMLFPFIPETKKWSEKGRKWFEQEIANQIYEDGTFLQFSMNYHRVVIQLLTLGISLTEMQGKPFSEGVYKKAHKSLNFLYQCAQDETAHLPNYGANDGAWFFPLSDTDYRDFRPQLNANRRFSPHMEKIKSVVGDNLMNVIATMNAGFIPPNVWVHDMKTGGGRIIGEACHYIDLIAYLTGSKVKAVCMNAMGVNPEVNTDNASILLRMENGSTGVINYFANGSKAYSKERVEVFSQERTLIMDNFRRTDAFGVKGFSKLKTSMDKGHKNQFHRLIKAVQQGGPALIPFESIVNTTRASFAAIQSLQENRWVEVE